MKFSPFLCLKKFKIQAATVPQRNRLWPSTPPPSNHIFSLNHEGPAVALADLHRHFSAFPPFTLSEHTLKATSSAKAGTTEGMENSWPGDKGSRQRVRQQHIPTDQLRMTWYNTVQQPEKHIWSEIQAGSSAFLVVAERKRITYSLKK